MGESRKWSLIDTGRSDKAQFHAEPRSESKTKNYFV